MDNELISALEASGVDLSSSDAALISQNSDSILAFLGLSMLALLFILLVLWVLVVIARWRTVSKMGGHGWSQLIPVYAEYELASKAGCSKALTYASTALAAAIIICGCFSSSVDAMGYLGGVLDFAALVVGCVVARQVSRVYKHGVPFTVGLILLPWLFYMILGLGKTMPEVPAVEDEAAPAAPEA